MAARWRFDGEIAAFGTTTGHRVVIGHWPVSPFGPFSDVMLEAPEGTRLLIAPSGEVARFIPQDGAPLCRRWRPSLADEAVYRHRPVHRVPGGVLPPWRCPW